MNNWVVVGGIDSPGEDRIRKRNRAVHLKSSYKPVNLKLPFRHLNVDVK